jgi:NAD(P)-dependent dehydrogenase (short-subunit alcohol dehydrogenase family)
MFLNEQYCSSATGTLGNTIAMTGLANQLGLEGRVVIVTGAAGGLGRAFADGFAAAGAKVVVADVALEGVEATAAAIRARLGTALAVQVDVTNAASLEALAARTLQTFAAIDVLVNNAAIYAGIVRKTFTEIDEADWDRIMAVNVKGTWLASKIIAPRMTSPGGAIINISSATVMSGSPQWLHYVASKGAIIAMTRAMARELGDQGIRVNALAPGFTLTDASLDLISGAATYGVDRGALKRASLPQDVVGAALYLASPLAAFVTGQTLIVDGGRQFG